MNFVRGLFLKGFRLMGGELFVEEVRYATSDPGTNLAGV